jgi:hypothetical protein
MSSSVLGIPVPAHVTLLHVTITENSAHTGGGLFLPARVRGSVKNSIIAQNFVDFDGTAPDVSSVFVFGSPDVVSNLGHNLIGDGTGSFLFFNGFNGDQVGTSADPIDPMLGPLQSNGGPTQTHALLAGSKAIDKGVADPAVTTDQRGAGFPRQKDGNGDGLKGVDIGAFEK